MIRRAFEEISDIPTRLICFSDDMDGMRKVPDNVPNQAMLRENLQRPLTSVPDPFGEFESFGAHNNAMLRRFLDTFGFEYEFVSATEFYRSGQFDAVLLRAAERYDALMEVMLASPARGAAAELFDLPADLADERAGALRAAEGGRTPRRERSPSTTRTARRRRCPSPAGNVKLQWKPDFGARWAALDVDFEMYGKDHSTNTPIYDRICEILGGRAPNHFTYELFLDENGEKISKSKGNGLTIDEWLTYADPESLAYFMYGKPKTAKRLFFDVIPKNVDEYHQQLRAFDGQDAAGAARQPGLAHPPGPAAGQRHGGAVLDAAQPRERGQRPRQGAALGLPAPLRARGEPGDPSGARCRRGPCGALLRGLRAAGEEVSRRRRARRRRRSPTCATGWRRGTAPADPEALQALVYAVGKDHGFEPLRAWFGAIYEVLLGEAQGPRFGGFIALYGIPETVALIDAGLAGTLGAA